jgi:hypothetical protein
MLQEGLAAPLEIFICTLKNGREERSCAGKILTARTALSLPVHSPRSVLGT